VSLSTPCLTAADASIAIQARAAEQRQSTTSGSRLLPMLTAKAGAALAAEWSITIPRDSTPLPGATVHVFLDRENSVGSAASPKPGKNALYESALIIDLGPGANTSGEFHMVAPERGNYLLRAELVAGGVKTGREIFAALRVVVQ
jgi:hypothetical protein